MDKYSIKFNESGQKFFNIPNIMKKIKNYNFLSIESTRGVLGYSI